MSSEAVSQRVALASDLEQVTLQIKEVECEIAELEQQVEEVRSKKRSLLEVKRTLQNDLLQLDLQSRKDMQKKESACAAGVSDPDLSSLRWKGSFRWDNEVEITLKKLGLSSFRKNQREVINCTLTGQDCFCVMPTGGGKSLCYQLPACMPSSIEKKLITLVISPLVSLIEDQVHQLKKLDIGVEMLSKTQNHQNRKQETARQRKLLKDIVGGTSHVSLLYVTPEKVVQSRMLISNLEKIYAQNRLARFVIDEAHCCSEWGHDFREDYTKLNILKQRFRKTPIIAVTATATKMVAKNVTDILQISDDCTFFRSSFNRPNLRYSVRPKLTGSLLIAEIANLIKSRWKGDTGIVYCLSRNDAEKTAASLSSLGVSCCAYHAGREDQVRSKILSLWLQDKIQVVVATIAFGLGINKMDVRFVIHLTQSKSIENYYQESGRAGRDGGEASCVLFYKAQDVCKLASMSWDNRNGMNKIRETVFAMAEYSQGSDCRRSSMSKYFSESVGSKICNGYCDNCQNSYEYDQRDVHDVACSFVGILHNSATASTNITMKALVDTARGVGKFKKFNHDGPVDKKK